jgi:DNA-binding winged helix-turn-helix (wHTH) protein
MPSVTSNLRAFGDFRVDAQNRTLWRGEVPVALTPKAFEVLLLLIQHSGEVVSKDELMKMVWPDSFVEESNLTQTVFMLRKALGETSEQRYVLTVQGRGYCFCTRSEVSPC